MSYPHVFTPKTQEPKKELTVDEMIKKIFFRTATLEKDVAALLHANGMESSNKFLNKP